MESDSFNPISLVSLDISKPWKVQFAFNEIKDLSSNLCLTFRHAVRSAYGFADALIKRLLGLLLGK